MRGGQVSQKKRKRIEEVFGWMKSIGLLRKLRHRGPECVGWMFTFAAAAYNLVRIRNLNAVPHSRRLQTALRRPRSQQTFKTAGAMKMAIGKQATLFVELLFFRSLSA
jgi:hypothetical protein